MFVRAAARYLGFSLGAGESGAGSTRAGAPDAPGSGTVESAARHTPLDDATTGERTGRWRRTVVRSVCALVVAGAVFGAYHVGRSQGIEQAQDETGGFIRPTPTGPTEPAVVADLLHLTFHLQQIVFTDPARLAEDAARHAAVFAAVERADGEAAATAMLTVILDAKRSLRHALAGTPEAGPDRVRR